MNDRPFAPACERNQAPIFDALSQHLPKSAQILEVGSGTGQHAVYFTARRPSWQWQCSDLAENLPGIQAWLADAPALPAPIALDVMDEHGWPTQAYDAVFTANTLHIMPWPAGVRLIAQLPRVLKPRGLFIAYGPFNYAGEFTSPSNAEFDAMLRARAPHQGIRDFERVDEHATGAGLRLVQDHPMPANNRLIVWQAR